ncbi:MAG TPA: hypothetical protein VFS33_11735 [Gemmatimonadales bacterium]|nr:hypothetical protein [Gemmatimonadales bacterium]
MVFVLACAVYLQTVSYGFAGDDLEIIRDRVLFHDLSRWREILAASWWPNALYRPVTALTLAVNWVAGSGDPRMFHAVNVLLHGVASVLVYWLAAGCMPRRAAVIAGLLFAVHPVHVEAVVNLVGRAEVLSTVFALAGVLLYRYDGALADGGDHRSWRRIAASFGALLATVLALGSKESAFALPGLVLLVDWYDGQTTGRSLGDSVRRHSLLWMAVLVTALGWLVLRARIVGDLTGVEVAPGLEGQGMFGRALVMLPIVVHYARLLLVPARLSVEYSPEFVQVPAAVTAMGLAGVAILALTAGVAVAARRRAPVVTLGIGWIGMAVLIVANILVPTGILLAERTLYLASVGVVLLLAWLAQWALRRAPSAAMACLALVVGAGALRVVTRNPIWRDDTTYFPAMVQDAPGSFRALWTAAELARQQGDFRRSEFLLRRAIQAHPLAWAVWQDLGKLLYVEGRYRESAECFWAAWRITGGGAWLAQRAIHASLRAGQVDAADSMLTQARQARPAMPAELMLAASDVALARGQYLRAMTWRRRVAWEYPDSARYWALTGQAALAARHCAEVRHSIARLRPLPGAGQSLRELEAAAPAQGCK